MQSYLGLWSNSPLEFSNIRRYIIVEKKGIRNKQKPNFSSSEEDAIPSASYYYAYTQRLFSFSPSAPSPGPTPSPQRKIISFTRTRPHEPRNRETRESGDKPRERNHSRRTGGILPLVDGEAFCSILQTEFVISEKYRSPWALFDSENRPPEIVLKNPR